MLHVGNPTFRECLKVIKIANVREHPRTEPAEAVTATRKLERLARKHGLTVEALLAHARAEALRAEAGAAAASSFFGTSSARRSGTGMAGLRQSATRRLV